MSHKLALEVAVDHYTATCSCGWIGVTFSGADADEAKTAAVEDGSQHLCDIA